MTNLLEKPLDAARLADHDFRLLIGGELVAPRGGNAFASENPATETTAGFVPDTHSSDAAAAVDAAAEAFKAWSRRPYKERRDIVLAIADRMSRFTAELGLIDTLENGNVLSAMKLDAAWSAKRMQYLAAVGYEVKGHVGNLSRDLQYTRHYPYGVVLRLLPFNHPIASAGTAIAAPLLMGNCVVLKPSPHTSLSALALGEVIRDIVPPGVVAILSGEGNELASSLITNEKVSRISLTGSVGAGQAVMRLAADRLVPLTLELGGKNPLIVFADADLDKAADIAIAGMNFKWQGHSCGSTSRILVHKSRKEEFSGKLRERVAGIRVASPLDPSAEMGAISFRALYQRCRDYVEAGQAEGARLLTGGTRPSTVDPQKGFFLSPALFDEVTPQMAIAREEIFGPVLSVIAWNDYDEMLAIANDLSLGLTAVVVTNDINLALDTVDRLEAGYVEVNGPVSHALGASFGGIKASGFGREGGIDELSSYVYAKSTNIRVTSSAARYGI